MDAPRINLAESPDFDLGGLRVSPARREVRKGNDRRELEPKVIQVLVALAAARSDVVSRDRLIEQCWNGRIVGDDALNRCIVALRHLAKEFAPEPFAIETVPRVGYSLVERHSDQRVVRRRSGAKTAVAALLVLLLFAGVGAIGWWRNGRTETAPASIAVLAFRNLSAGDPYFAEGIGEEIVGQLAHEPQFRVAGRTSSSELGKDADFRDVARRLNVDYVLEGSVRTQGDRVRVNADLVRASDGIQLWSDSFDGKLDDIFAIQQQIGRDIAGALERKLFRVPVLSGPLVTNGEAYNLYLTARGLIRTRNRHVAATASNLLRDAINLDPRYAPAWASLAEAVSLEDPADPDEGQIAALPKAQAYARHALRLAPDFADAHRTLGMVLINGSAESQAHLRRAAQLDPNSAENMLGLAVALGNEGKFEDQMAAYRRAGILDPLWFRTTGAQAIALAEAGNRAEAEAVAKRGFARDINNQHILLGRIAWILGDYSESIRQWSIVAKADSPRWSFRAREDLGNARTALGLASLDPTRLGMRRRTRMSIEPPPDPATWRLHNRNALAADVYGDENEVAAKEMLKTGRASELIASYDGPVGLLGLRRGDRLRVDLLNSAPIVVLALRQGGRTAEADRLIGQADAMAQDVYRASRVPFRLDAEAAAIWAVQGRKEQALGALESALGRGWTHSGSVDLPDLSEEPAFASLHGEPRFERLQANLAAHFARERAETMRLRS